MSTAAERFETVPYEGPERMYLIVRRMWKPLIAMGGMIVLASLIIGAWNASANVADHFGNAKSVRDAAARGSELLAQLGRSEAVKAWLPGVKFFGMGLLLAGITAVVATILGTLRESGARVQKAVNASDVVALRKPLTGRAFPMFMMFGLMILVGTLVVSSYLATQVGDYYSATKAVRESSRPFVAQFGEIQAIRSWVEPLKFVGLISLLTGIGLALATIIRVLRFQAYRIEQLSRGETPRARVDAVVQTRTRTKAAVAARPTRNAVDASLEHESMYHPGQAAPQSGVYVCDLDRKLVHLKRGRTIPPCPGGSDHNFRLVPDDQHHRAHSH